MTEEFTAKTAEQVRKEERERIRQRLREREARLEAELSALREVEAVLDEEEKPETEPTETSE